MKNIFLIEEFKFYEKTHFYTIRDENKADSETDLFIKRFFEENASGFQNDYYDDLTLILEWIRQIGKRGMKICSLRHENDAKALPPDKILPADLLYLGRNRGKLRLYCIPLPPGVIILCGGGLKTSQKVQESPDLIAHFRLANQIAKKITEALISQEITIERGKLQGLMEIWI
ncbi:MAG: hypothetical protein R3C61_05540 [Bacteroidia bacterium]